MTLHANRFDSVFARPFRQEGLTPSGKDSAEESRHHQGQQPRVRHRSSLQNRPGVASIRAEAWTRRGASIIRELDGLTPMRCVHPILVDPGAAVYEPLGLFTLLLPPWPTD